MTRGEQSAVRNAMNDLSAQFFEGIVNKDLHRVFPKLQEGSKKYMQMIVQPIQLWSLVFPQEELATVQNTIHTNELERYHPKRDKLYLAALRKMLQAKKCPPLNLDGKKRIIRSDGVEFLPIGIKEDNFSSGFEGL